MKNMFLAIMLLPSLAFADQPKTTIDYELKNSKIYKIEKVSMELTLSLPKQFDSMNLQGENTIKTTQTYSRVVDSFKVIGATEKTAWRVGMQKAYDRPGLKTVFDSTEQYFDARFLLWAKYNHVKEICEFDPKYKVFTFDREGTTPETKIFWFRFLASLALITAFMRWCVNGWIPKAFAISRKVLVTVIWVAIMYLIFLPLISAVIVPMFYGFGNNFVLIEITTLNDLLMLWGFFLFLYLLDLFAEIEKEKRKLKEIQKTTSS